METQAPKMPPPASGTAGGTVKRIFILAMTLALCGLLTACPKILGGPEADPAAAAKEKLDEGFADLNDKIKTLEELLAKPPVDGPEVISAFRKASGDLLTLSALPGQEQVLLLDNAKLLREYLPKFAASGYTFDRFLSQMSKAGILSPAALTAKARSDLTGGLNNLATAAWNFYRQPATKGVNPIAQFLNLLKSKEPPKEAVPGSAV